MYFNYDSSVKDECNRLMAQNASFSAYDITKALREASNKSFAPQQIYHSIVRGIVHEYMKRISSYIQENSDDDSHIVYKSTISLLGIKIPPLPITLSLPPTFGSFPAQLSNQTPSVNSFVTILSKGMNGKFTVPKVMLNDAIRINNRTITVKFMTGGKVTSQKVYEIDKSNNIRFRLPCNKVIVQKTSSPTILVVRSN